MTTRRGASSPAPSSSNPSVLRTSTIVARLLPGEATGPAIADAPAAEGEELLLEAEELFSIQASFRRSGVRTIRPRTSPPPFSAALYPPRPRRPAPPTLTTRRRRTTLMPQTNPATPPPRPAARIARRGTLPPPPPPGLSPSVQRTAPSLVAPPAPPTPSHRTAPPPAPGTAPIAPPPAPPVTLSRLSAVRMPISTQSYTLSELRPHIQHAAHAFAPPTTPHTGTAPPPAPPNTAHEADIPGAPTAAPRPTHTETPQSAAAALSAAPPAAADAERTEALVMTHSHANLPLRAVDATADANPPAAAPLSTPPLAAAGVTPAVSLIEGTPATADAGEAATQIAIRKPWPRSTIMAAAAIVLSSGLALLWSMSSSPQKPATQATTRPGAKSAARNGQAQASGHAAPATQPTTPTRATATPSAPTAASATTSHAEPDTAPVAATPVAAPKTTPRETAAPPAAQPRIRPKLPSRRRVQRIMRLAQRRAGRCVTAPHGALRFANLTVARTGRVRKVHFPRAGLSRGEHRCVLRALRRSRFPAFRQPRFTLRYPIRY